MANAPLACTHQERAAEPEAEHPARVSAPAGLVFTHASPEKGLSGTFSKNGLLIRFTCIRGARAQDSLAGDPTAPPYIMGTLITNVGGYALVQSGPSPEEPPDADPSRENVEAELRLVVELGKALQSARLPSNMEFERRALIQVARVTATSTPPCLPPGCARNDIKAPAGVTEQVQPAGLVVSQASPEAGLIGSYTRDGRTIRFRCVRTGRNRDSVAGDPTAQPYVVSSTITNTAGDVLVSSGQGPDRLPQSASPPAQEAREAEFALVASLEKVIAEAKLPESMGPERRELINVARASSPTHRPQPVMPNQ